MGKYYSYMRISTSEERGLQKFSRQESALKKYEKENAITFWKEFRDDASGKSFDRDAWKLLESGVDAGDTIVFKDISRFTREAENGYAKYMELMDKGINLVFIDNQTVSNSYIKALLHVAEKQNLVAKISLENTVKLLLYVELDRVEQERLILQKRIRDGIAASEKKSGRKKGALDKMTPELKEDIKLYLKDRSIRQIDLLSKHHLSRNTLKKYIQTVNDN